MKVAREELHIPTGAVSVAGDLAVPENATAVIVFVHGAGSSRFSPRNQFVAGEMQLRGFATVLLDLLTPDEEAMDFRTAQFRYDVEMLARRIIDVTHWLRRHESTRDLRIGILGVSTGAAAALIAAAHSPDDIGAIVSRGGRPDLAIATLPRVRAATLLVIGSEDRPLIRMNRDAYAHLACDKRLDIVEGAGHLFDEPGALQEVATSAAEWFALHLTAVPAT